MKLESVNKKIFANVKDDDVRLAILTIVEIGRASCRERV